MEYNITLSPPGQLRTQNCDVIRTTSARGR